MLHLGIQNAGAAALCSQLLADGAGDHLVIWAQWMMHCVVLNHCFDAEFLLRWSLLHVILKQRGFVCLFFLVARSCCQPNLVVSLLHGFLLKALWTGISLLAVFKAHPWVSSSKGSSCGGSALNI